jgi:hypothetical protein
MRLSAEVEQIFEAEDGAVVTFREILDRISVKSFGVLLPLLALPSALPLPAPGYSTPFGIALVFLAVQVIARREYPWFPERVLRKTIRARGNRRLVSLMVRFLQFFEALVRPRFRFVYTNPVMYRALGVVMLLCGASMCIFIPLTNTVPAMGIFLIGIGMIEEDGLAALAGVAVAVVGLALSAAAIGAVLYFGSGGAELVKEYIKGLLGA